MTRTNKQQRQCASRVRKIARQYMNRVCDTKPDFVTDLLADLRHYCDAEGVDFANQDRIAYGHYRVELKEVA